VRSVRYHPDARAEFLHEVEYYSRLSVRLGERFDKAVLTAEARAAETPELWPKYKHKTRRVVDRKFKFSLVYLYNESGITVVAVAPFRRRPGYWKARLSDG
jgi:L-amino acid N-acyltransferase YncA